MEKRRTLIATLAGALLGVLCIAGVGYRLGFAGNWLFLLATWYNRVLMGFLIGVASDFKVLQSHRNKYVRGLVLGTLVTSALFLSTQFRDLPSFFAGMVYGAIIDYLATRFG
ncbi:MAG: hypothetical protein ACLFM9_00170 [Candidatus Aenigmatarchaeota archaeon]